MDRLAWCTAKAQLYLTEAAYVKDSVGRDRIRRNKDTLRELRCLQEILSDLHAGEFGRAPERRRQAVEAAKSRWTALCKAAKQDGKSLEDCCEVRPSVRRFFTALPIGSICTARARSSGSDAATSTRAPSEAVVDLDVHSTATESLLSDFPNPADGISTSMALRPGGGQRLSRDQLDRLAAELIEQLDQENTSLLSSIEEVQALMEAEVAGASLLPSIEELEAFARDADAALRYLEGLRSTIDTESKDLDETRREHIDATGSPSLVHEDRYPLRVDSESCSEEKNRETIKEEGFSRRELPASEESLAHRCHCEVESSVAIQSGMGAWQSEVKSQMPPSRKVESRPRWADLSDDDDDETFDISMFVAPTPPAGGAMRERGGTLPARAMCSKCRHELGKDSFSRRAWRQARGLGGASLTAGTREGAVCRACSVES